MNLCNSFNKFSIESIPIQYLLYDVTSRRGHVILCLSSIELTRHAFYTHCMFQMHKDCFSCFNLTNLQEIILSHTRAA
jgi:hypothetical protein